MKNYTVAVKEKGKDVAFLRRIIRGGADRSYGIHVAKLAGLPQSVLKRAEVILQSLETDHPGSDDLSQRVGNVELNARQVGSSTNAGRMVMNNKPTMDSMDVGNLFTHSVVDSLLAVDVMSMTPIEALNTLYQLQEEARKGGGK